MTRKLTHAVYQVTPAMIERLKVGSLHHAVCTDENDDGLGLLVAICGDEPGKSSQSAQYARLFAAAPDLLAGAKACITMLTSYGDESSLFAASFLIKEIAKAEGGSK